MSLAHARMQPVEQDRINSLMSLVPKGSSSILDVGSRDGFLARKLLDYTEKVTALDLVEPDIQHERITSLQGDVTSLKLDDDSFDVVFCAEVLEHIPSHLLEQACNELKRVSKKYIVIGVPYKQDIRHSRTTCGKCGEINPPWGHVNSFDENRIQSLFRNLNIVNVTFVGESNEITNSLSTFLMDLAGNPYGTYHQDEPCVGCDSVLENPIERTFIQKVFTKLAIKINVVQNFFAKSHANWIHVLIEK